MPGKDGLLHISEIKWRELRIWSVLEEGEEVKVKLIEIDRRTGKFRLSRKLYYQSQKKISNGDKKVDILIIGSECRVYCCNLYV